MSCWEAFQELSVSLDAVVSVGQDLHPHPTWGSRGGREDSWGNGKGGWILAG